MVKGAILREETGISPAIFSRRTHLSCERHSPFNQIDHRQHGERTIGILGQTAIARLGETPDALQGVEPMLDLGADQRFAPVVRFIKFYIVRLGFLDGVPGLVHIAIGCQNSMIKYAKLRELGRAGNSPA